MLAFQRAHGLAADGVAGPRTRLALAEATGDVLAARSTAGAHLPAPATRSAPAAPTPSAPTPSAPVETAAMWNHPSPSRRHAARPAATDAASHVPGSDTAPNPWRRMIEAGRAVEARRQHAPVLAEGARGAAVQALQRGLDAAGARDRDGHRLRVDGVFGAHTRQAVRDFQEAHGLAADGVAGRDTHAALAAAAPQASTVVAPASVQNADARPRAR